MSKQLKWTKRKPTESGWYFRRDHGNYVWVEEFRLRRDLREKLVLTDSNYQIVSQTIYSGDFAGPISEPKEDK